MFIDFPEVEVKLEGMGQVVLPKMVCIHQKYDAARIEDVTGHLKWELEEKVKAKHSYEGMRVAITAGSRGIPHYHEIVRTLVDTLTAWGARPFIVPAMGGHAGASTEGQIEMLAGYGITEAAMGCPIMATMEAEEIGLLSDGTKLYCDRYAWQADGIVVLNKVKPHTSFKAEHESGLLKMLAIGLGKHIGAAAMHMRGYDAFPELISEAGKLCIEKEPILFAVGIVQNAYDDICILEVIEKDGIVAADKKLLETAKDKLARFKFPETDVLIIDQIGKNIGGAGFDPNVVARRDRVYPGALVSQNIFVRGLTKESHHNASGIGTVEVTTLRCARDVDWGITWTNMMTANFLPGCRIPCFAKNDREALRWAIRTCTGIDYENARVVRIRDTMHMEYIQISENLLQSLGNRDDVEVISEPFDIVFGEDGYMDDV